ncbi:MAG: VWA domain-containing protein [Gammaproteobacteria bacterium]
MAHKRRQLSAFNLSFLDIMSCGFGAVVLLFLIIKHNVNANVPSAKTTPDLTSEVKLLEEEVREGKEGRAKLRNTVAEIDMQTVTAQGLARRITEEIRKKETAGETEASKAAAEDSEVERLKTDIKKLEEQKQRLEQETTETGKDTRSFIGEGNREYLTGLKLGGKRIMILLDTSASMLDKTIVNIIRRRNMPDERKRNSQKWQQALKTVDWLSTRFPISSGYQVYTFNTDTKPVVTDSQGQWLKVKDKDQLDNLVKSMKKIIPGGGTNLETAFASVKKLRPLPDNIYLITDGLPTRGKKKPRGTTISGKQRLKLFERALKNLPQGIPVNVILLPMEGDPMAASAFWQLAQFTEGSFISPTEDWP